MGGRLPTRLVLEHVAIAGLQLGRGQADARAVGVHTHNQRVHALAHLKQLLRARTAAPAVSMAPGRS